MRNSNIYDIKRTLSMLMKIMSYAQKLQSTDHCKLPIRLICHQTLRRLSSQCGREIWTPTIPSNWWSSCDCDQKLLKRPCDKMCFVNCCFQGQAWSLYFIFKANTDETFNHLQAHWWRPCKIIKSSHCKWTPWFHSSINCCFHIQDLTFQKSSLKGWEIQTSTIPEGKTICWWSSCDVIKSSGTATATNELGD